MNPEVDSSTVDLSEFTPRMPNCSYLFYYFGESNDTIYTTDKVRVAEHGKRSVENHIFGQLMAAGTL